MKILSKVDTDTYYVVTTNHVRMVRNGDKLTIPYCHIPEKAKLFKPEIQAELLGFWEEKYPERPCKVCGTLFRSNRPHDVFCSPECKKASRSAYRKSYNEKAVERQCGWCSNTFAVPASNSRRYCNTECRKAAAAKKKELEKEAVETTTEETKWESRLNEKLQQAAALGITYADIQKRETLKQVGGVVI